jgi:hypothetical protein
MPADSKNFKNTNQSIAINTTIFIEFYPTISQRVQHIKFIVHVTIQMQTKGKRRSTKKAIVHF